MTYLSMGDARSLSLLALVVLATSLPFINRAYFIDDYYFVTMANGIRENPWRPYDFKSDDAGLGNVAWERGQLPRMVNPPLMHYYLASVMELFGEETWKLRLSYLVFSFMTLFSMYFLGKRFVLKPLLPTLLMAICPAYWLTSYSLLIDGMLVAFLLASLLAFVKAHDEQKVSWVILSGFLMGLTILVKYFGVLVLPLVFVWQWIDPKRRQWMPGYLAIVVCLAVQFVWAAWNIATYGQSHFLAALGRGFTASSTLLLSQKSLMVLSFLGGGTVFLLACIAMLWKSSRGWFIGLLSVTIAFYALFSSPIGGFDKTQSFLLAFFVLGTSAFLIMAVRKLKIPADSKHTFLSIWVVLGLVELVVAMPWTAGRYLLSVLPAIAWIFAILLRELKWESLWKPVLVISALVSLVVAHGDYAQANTIKKLSTQLAARSDVLEKLSPQSKYRRYYLSDTFDGSQPYLAPLGWQNALPGQKFKRGDLFMRAYYRRSSWWNVEEELKKFKLLAVIEMKSRNPVRTMDVPASAGFYASCWGALPWIPTHHPLERYELYQVINE